MLAFRLEFFLFRIGNAQWNESNASAAHLTAQEKWEEPERRTSSTHLNKSVSKSILSVNHFLTLTKANRIILCKLRRTRIRMTNIVAPIDRKMLHKYLREISETYKWDAADISTSVKHYLAT